ncbi:MAG: hypothetical protein OEZ65_09850 [Gemmatimonadota bacterium]|nr:hypothetical protein [Gemmatimonadota bacterium]MDH5759880.1 hypothetical protein [Gemmatimonadota bacterium]
MTKQMCGLLFALAWACAPPSKAPLDGPDGPAQVILDGAQRAMGVWPTPDSLQMLADAFVRGPSRAFRTVIYSSADGRVRMYQSHTGFLAGVGRSGGWLVDFESGATESLGESSAFVRTHELHMLALLPRSRLAAPRFLGTTQLDSLPVLAVGFSGDSVIAYFSEADTLPVGLLVTWPDPAVAVSWSEWTEVNGVALFREASFRQEAEEWHYTYDRLELIPLPDSVFEPPRER